MSEVSFSVFAGGLDHPEGVAAYGNDSIVAGGEAGQIYLIDAHGTSRQIAATGGYCLGMAVDAQGSLYVCDMGRHAVLRYSFDTDSIEDLTTGIGDEPVKVPNYPVFDSSGRLYFSDSRDWGANNGILFVRHPDGRVEVASREVNGYTNGLAIDPSQEYLYVVESSVPAITRCQLNPDGSLGPREIYVEMRDQVPDGIAFTREGDLLIACYRPDTVYFFRGGELDILIADQKGLSISAPTNVAFFGEELTRLAFANLAGNFVGEITCDLVGHRLNYPEVAQ